MIKFYQLVSSQIARSMRPTWGPPGSCRPQMGPMLAPWTLLSGISIKSHAVCFRPCDAWSTRPPTTVPDRAVTTAPPIATQRRFFWASCDSKLFSMCRDTIWISASFHLGTNYELNLKNLMAVSMQWFGYKFMASQIERFMGPTWGPPGSCRPRMGLLLAPWTLPSEVVPFTIMHATYV